MLASVSSASEQSFRVLAVFVTGGSAGKPPPGVAAGVVRVEAGEQGLGAASPQYLGHTR